MIQAFHGSPGLPEDYAPLAQALSKTLGDSALHPVIREGYPGAKAEPPPGPSFYLGYSFGGADCVETAAKDPSAQGIILVAPYLYPTKSPGLMTELLLAIPGLSDFLLGKIGAKAMKGFIEKSAYPAQVPVGYLEIGNRYAKPAILRRAMTESKGRGPGIQKALERLSKRDVPLLVIWGRQDQTGSEAEQIAPLRKLFPKLHEVTLDTAGHALIWTHPEELVREITRFTRGEKL